ncbi:MAG: stalk domain-containing protein, partial [Desulfofundulus sp.]
PHQGPFSQDLTDYIVQGGVLMRRARWTALLLVVAVLGVYGIAQGASFTKTVKAVYRNISIIVDGKAAAAAEEEPFIIDGRVYVPLRYVSELVGAQVSWDGTNNRVLITTTPKSDPAKEQAKWQEGYNAGLVQGQLMASKSSYDKGYKEGYDEGYEKGKEDGYDEG